MGERRHVHEADVVRVLTFACVIGVHTLSHSAPASSVGANGILMLLHFTREAFFGLTGFVLVHQYARRPLSVRRFWTRRLLTVGVPYLAWTAIYTAYGIHTSSSDWGQRLPTTLRNVEFGTACYHLYFLLVSLQVYLLYPLLAALIRRTVGHHLTLLIVSGGLQLATLIYYHYDASTSGWLGHVVAHEEVLLPSYQFYVVAGAVAAWHLDAWTRWVRANFALVLGAVVATAALAEGWYLVDADGPPGPLAASAVLQPVMLPWSIAATVGLFALGVVWSDRRRPGGRLDRALNVASDRSFGVYLVHPLFVGWTLSELQGHLATVPLTLITYPIVVIAALLSVELMRRSPISLILTGRNRLRRPPKRKESGNAIDNAPSPATRGQAPHARGHDGDRLGTADAAVH